MPNLPDRADLEALRAFDTPTICNALEIVAPARRATGFIRRPLVAAFPEMKPVVAFARTAHHPLARAAPARPRRGEGDAAWLLRAHRGRAVAEHRGDPGHRRARSPGFGAFWGEVQTQCPQGARLRRRHHRRLGARPRCDGARFLRARRLDHAVARALSIWSISAARSASPA